MFVSLFGLLANYHPGDNFPLSNSNVFHFSTHMLCYVFASDDDDISEISSEMDDLDDDDESMGSVEKWWDDGEVGSGGSQFSSGKHLSLSDFVIEVFT